jgi:hypothetical protein
VVIKVHDGTLLMFASYLEHSVDANKSHEERGTRNEERDPSRGDS